jgi:hypothetical protein
MAQPKSVSASGQQQTHEAHDHACLTRSGQAGTRACRQIDVPAAFAASSKVRPAVYGQPVPQVASNLIGVSALAFPEQLIEIAFRAEVQP